MSVEKKVVPTFKIYSPEDLSKFWFVSWKQDGKRIRHHIGINQFQTFEERMSAAERLIGLIVLGAKKLRYHYGAIVGDKKQFHYYKNLFEHYRAILAAAEKTEGYYLEIAFEFTQSKSLHQAVIEQAKRYAAELEDYVAEFDNYWIQMFAFNLFGLVKQMESDYEGLLDVCDRAIAQFNKETKILGPIFTFTYKKIACYLQLQRFEEAYQAIQLCLGMVREGTYNWIITLEYQVMFGFHSGQFQVSYVAIKQLRKHLGQMEATTREECLILDAYVHFFIGTGDIIPDETEHFKPAKFFNEVPIFSKDKAGLHVNILILQTLHALLKRRKHPVLAENEITRQRHALEKYVVRHLKGDYLKWARIFMKMLVQISAGYFNPTNVMLKATKDVERLKNANQQWANQRAKLEPAPYLLLWERVLELLEG